MSGRTDGKVEVRKNWVAPKLKKVDIKLITALGPDHAHDEYTHS